MFIIRVIFIRFIKNNFIMKKTIKKFSKTFLSSLVIFNLVFVTSGTPVVASAMVSRLETIPATQTPENGEKDD